MAMKPPRWSAITQSAFEWERAALEFLREHLPEHEPWRAWANFEFIDDQGRVNEVDVLVLTPQGLVLVEIKSRPGAVEGDAHSWTWNTDGRRTTVDNPLRLANRKAQRLASLLRRQDAIAKSPVQAPWVEAAIFLSAVRPPLRLDASTRNRVFLRGRPGREDDDGIVGAITTTLTSAFPRRQPIEASASRVIARAIEQAGIRPSLRERRIGDYELGQLLAEGDGWQDFEARHVSLGVQRRVRIYPYAAAASTDARARLGRMAARAFRILEGVDHPGILKVLDFKESERGPALIFEHDPKAMRFDLLLRERGGGMSAELRLDLLRQLAEALRYAHSKSLYHRALAPQSVLVRDVDAPRPRVQIMDWQAGSRSDPGAATPERTSGTRHLDDYVADPAKVYLAPESLQGAAVPAPHHDVFSLGAIAYHLFTGKPPAVSPLELPEKLRAGDGLRLSDALDGAGRDLEELIRASTNPDVGGRIESVDEFLVYLADAEKEGRVEASEATVDPSIAKSGDVLERGLVVVRRLGRGGSSDALVVRQGEGAEELVLKVAIDAAHGERIKGEAEVLKRLRWPNIVRYVDDFPIAGRHAILMEKAGEMSLARHLRSAEPPALDLMRRFGEELLQTLDYLEQEGVAHRDIKPDNIGVAEAGKSSRKRLVLFDFSLARTSPDNIQAGTRPYLDPFLGLRRPPRWDLYAERFAAAVTLHEMLTGTVPTWGDGVSDPALLDDEATIESDRFEPNLRDGLTAFFDRALRREPRERFDNAEEMLRAWRQVFEAIDRRPISEDSLELVARRVEARTPVTELGYGIEALDVLANMGIHTAQQLLAVDRRRFRYRKNVSERVRREIRLKAKRLAQLRPDLVQGGVAAGTGRASVDRLANQLVPLRPAGEEPIEDRVLAAFLGLDAVNGSSSWLSAGDVAKACSVARSVVAGALERARERWHKSRDLNETRDDIAALLATSAGVMTVHELAMQLRAARGSVEEDEAEILRLATAVLRACIELEAARERPRFALFAETVPALVAGDEEAAAYAWLLGEEADRLAASDPLPSPARAEEELALVPRPEGTAPLPLQRLLRLAATASRRAALSSRNELYPRGMAAEQALRLSLGSLAGARVLTPEQIRERVHGRYPDAEPLPERPALDRLLADAGADRDWREDGDAGPGYYARHMAFASTGTTSPHRYDTAAPAVDATPEVLDARALEEKLRHAARTGGFLALTVEPRRMAQAEAEVLRRFPRERLSLDRLLLEAMRAQAETLKVRWPVVLAADAEAQRQPRLPEPAPPRRPRRPGGPAAHPDAAPAPRS